MAAARHQGVRLAAAMEAFLPRDSSGPDGAPEISNGTQDQLEEFLAQLSRQKQSARSTSR